MNALVYADIDQGIHKGKSKVKSEQEWLALCKNIHICAELNPQNGFIVIFK